eukprot:10626330-Lingulodinium_polyedra.AAC.1
MTAFGGTWPAGRYARHVAGRGAPRPAREDAGGGRGRQEEILLFGLAAATWAYVFRGGEN